MGHPPHHPTPPPTFKHEEVMAKIQNLEQVSKEHDMVMKKLDKRIKDLEKLDQGE